MSKGGRYAKKNEHRGGSVVLVVIAVVLILAVAGSVGFLVYNKTAGKPQLQVMETTAPIVTEAPEISQAVETTEETTEATTVVTEPPYQASGKSIINVLLIGQQSRAGEDARTADTMILATVNKNTKTLTLTSFLRDAYVQLPAFRTPSGKQRINVCYHLGYLWGDTGGAMQKINECIKYNFGIEVDYDIEVSFDGFTDIIDMLGGVYVELTEAEADYLNADTRYVRREMQPGPIVLEGAEALSYARMRKANGDGDSDIKRTIRQRAVITSVFESVKNLSFSELQNLVNTALPMITTNMTDDDILTCMWEILPLLPELKIETGTCPVETTYKGVMMDIANNGQLASVLQFDRGQNTRLMQAITEEPAPETATEPSA